MKIISFVLFLLLTLSLLNIYAQNTQTGLASFYADKFDGRTTASGEIFRQNKMTAAHRTLPFGTQVKVTNLENNNTVIVTINDRGPFVNDRIIDLSKVAAQKLDFISNGVCRVKVEVLSSNSTNTTNTQVTPKEEKPSVNNQTENRTQEANVSIAESAQEYYKINADIISPAGFGIQVASYQEAANLMKRCNEIKQKSNKDVLVQVANNNGKKLYRIIIGSFISREDATDYNNKVKKHFPGSFVLAF